MATELQPHQQRVVDEAKELRDKTEKLQAFFSNPIFDTLSSTDMSYLIAQHSAMLSYLTILELRIERFGIRKSDDAEQSAIEKANDLLSGVKLTITQLTDGNDTVTPRNTP